MKDPTFLLNAESRLRLRRVQKARNTPKKGIPSSPSAASDLRCVLSRGSLLYYCCTSFPVIKTRGLHRERHSPDYALAVSTIRCGFFGRTASGGVVVRPGCLLSPNNLQPLDIWGCALGYFIDQHRWHLAPNAGGI